MKKLLILMISIIATLSFNGCDTFSEVKPEVLAKYPECVVMMNAGEIYKGDKDKSGTVTPLTECLKSIKRQRCAREVFKTFTESKDHKIYSVDWGCSKEKMNQFNECMLK